jgi:hypothetical protein
MPELSRGACVIQQQKTFKMQKFPDRYNLPASGKAAFHVHQGTGKELSILVLMMSRILKTHMGLQKSARRCITHCLSDDQKW